MRADSAGQPFLVALAIAVLGCSPNPASRGFEPVQAEAAMYWLFDLGVTDVDGDGRLDLFTVNHSSPQSVLLNRGGGVLEEVFDGLGLDQSPGFPGLASTEAPPQRAAAALYVYWVGPELIVDNLARVAVSGHLALDSPVELVDRQGSEVALTGSTRVSFRMPPGSKFRVRPELHAMPIAFDVMGLDPAEIRVGVQGVHPRGNSFTLRLADRHGLVWLDADDDGDSDLFVTRGGMKGQMRKLPQAFWEELFVRSELGYRDVGRSMGLSKRGCPGRQAAAVDADADGRLDLYVACGRNGETHPNQLFSRVESGRFVDTAPEVGLDIGEIGAFTWLDVDADGDMDLLWDGVGHAALYRNTPGSVFVREPLEGALRASSRKHLSVVDFDDDGDLDVFSACRCGNLLLRNTGTHLEAEPVERLGLPERSLTANWVDYDNDGRMDLHVIPNGLYVQGRDRQFLASGLLGQSDARFSRYRAERAVASWFDLDGDGTRDLVYVLEEHLKSSPWVRWLSRLQQLFAGPPPQRRWQMTLLRNRHDANHWLQVDLTGARGNREAIGARVEIESGDHRQVRQVGFAEGSQYSQGHRRIYFGLGDAARVDWLNVYWPDGSISRMSGVPANQRLSIEQQPSPHQWSIR